MSLAFASTLLAPPPAGAGHLSEPPPHSPECPAPVVAGHYDRDEFGVAVSLPVSGCPAREGRQFPLWLSVTRYDDVSAHGSTRGTLCGPYEPSSGTGVAAGTCEVDLTLEHPPIEEAYYDVEVNYPGPDGDASAVYELVCLSDADGGACDVPGDGR